TLFLMLLLFFSLSWLWAEELPPGQIFDPLPCLHDAGQSYALYLPTAYQPGRRWPVMYCFDPGGKGSIPVGLFREGAEKYGCILVGSNNSRNGPWEIILQASRAIWRDSHARLAIDDQRIYSAGFSGGARAACGLGKMLSVKLSGVIACGGGLPAWLDPKDVIDVPWFGTAGLADFNYSEMQELSGKLGAQGTPQRLEIFPGRHSWPLPELATAALAWLDLQAMKSGALDRDDEKIATLLTQALEKARELENKQEWGSAYSQYASIAADFSGLADVNPAREKAANLRKTGSVKDFIKNESDRESEYARSLVRLKTTYSQLRGPLLEPGKSRKIVKELAIPALRKKADSKDMEPEHFVARRLLAALFNQAINDGQTYLEQKDGIRAVLAFQIAVEINPGHPSVLAALATALALNGERKKALKTIAAAIRGGYDDPEELEHESAWDGLRTDPEFLKIVAAMKKSPGCG
ncbi:MAG: hypothetical protein KKG79_08725, partial [Acidobacteria bacterium]|nr:hypothetical protein [Acidobacteriota bacterium]